MQKSNSINDARYCLCTFKAVIYEVFNIHDYMRKQDHGTQIPDCQEKCQSMMKFP